MWAFLKGLLTAIPAISKLIDAVTGYYHDKGVKDAQRNKDQRDQAVAGLSEIDKAQRARDAAESGMRADPGSVREPDRDTAARGSDGIS